MQNNIGFNKYILYILYNKFNTDKRLVTPPGHALYI